MIVAVTVSAARPSARTDDLQPSAAIRRDFALDTPSDRDFARAVRQRFPLRLFDWEDK